MRDKTVKHLEDNIVKYLCGFGVAKYCLNRTHTHTHTNTNQEVVFIIAKKLEVTQMSIN